VLAEIHTEWKYESLDGVFVEVARKTGDREAEMSGMCTLISDQTLTPYHLLMRVASATDDIEWFDCKLGEMRRGKLVRIPYDLRHGGKLSVANRLSDIEWKYHFGFGSRHDGV
jgi:hypothetical protein